MISSPPAPSEPNNLAKIHCCGKELTFKEIFKSATFIFFLIIIGVPTGVIISRHVNARVSESVYNVTVEFQVSTQKTDFDTVEKETNESFSNNFGDKMKNLTISHQLDYAGKYTQYNITFNYESVERVKVTQSDLDQEIKKIYVNSFINDVNEILVMVKCNSNCDEDICPTGFYWDGKTCADVNECTEDTKPCPADATCTNTDGSYTCTCNFGSSEDGSCVNIDECATQTDDCDSNAVCTNTPGSYSCECLEGYAGDGFNCYDMDECTGGAHNCDTNASCTDKDGGFACTCNSGYSGNGTVCTDDDECVSNPCGQGTCTNTFGGYSCSCNDGYVLSQTNHPACLIKPVLVLGKSGSTWKAPMIIKNKG